MKTVITHSYTVGWTQPSGPALKSSSIIWLVAMWGLLSAYRRREDGPHFRTTRPKWTQWWQRPQHWTPVRTTVRCVLCSHYKSLRKQSVQTLHQMADQSMRSTTCKAIISTLMTVCAVIICCAILCCHWILLFCSIRMCFSHIFLISKLYNNFLHNI